MSDNLHRSGPDLGDGDWAVSIDPDGAGWSFSGLRVIELAAGGSVGFDTGEDEVIVLPLSGAARRGVRRARRPSSPGGPVSSPG